MSVDRTRARWGWHRLTDRAARQLVADANIRASDLVLDVGAGTGAITAALVDAGARVVAIELHAIRAQVLRDRFADAPVVVVQADAADLRLPRRPFRVVANPPFDITSPLLRRLLVPGNRMISADLVVARQAARNWTNRHANGANRWSATFDVQVVRAISRSDFVPRPTVDAVVLRIGRRR